MWKEICFSLFLLPTSSATSLLIAAKDGFTQAIDSAANWSTSKLHSRTYLNSSFKVPKSLAARYEDACLAYPSDTKSLLFSIFTDSGDGIVHEEALYGPNAVKLIQSLNLAQIEPQIALDLVGEGKNGILALMKKFVRLNDAYLTATMEKRFSECMDQLALKATVFRFHDKMTLRSYILDDALEEMPACGDLPTFSTQVETVIYGLSRDPSTDYGKLLAHAALTSKPKVFANGSNERAARKRLLQILDKLKEKPGYGAAAEEFVRENGRTRRSEPYRAHKLKIYQRDWLYLDENPSYE